MAANLFLTVDRKVGQKDELLKGHNLFTSSLFLLFKNHSKCYLNKTQGEQVYATGKIDRCQAKSETNWVKLILCLHGYQEIDRKLR